MRTNKFRLSLAVAGLLVAAGVTNAAAETDGAFVGVQVGLGGVKAKTEFEADTGDATMGIVSANAEKTASSFRYGIVAGYKQFFTESFGLRYYGVFDYGTESKHKVAPSPDMNNVSAGLSGNYAAMLFNFTETAKLSTLNFSANVDALYNFVQNESLDFGVFGGLSLGYTSTTARNVSINGENSTSDGYTYGDISVGGFDLGVNFGLRANIAKRHGVELYSRFAFLQQKGDNVYAVPGGGSVTTNLKVSQPYAVGLRYVFSF